MSTIQKIKNRLVGKHLYYTCQKDGHSRRIGKYIGKVIDITSGFTVLVKSETTTSPVPLSITTLNQQHLNGEVVILPKPI